MHLQLNALHKQTLGGECGCLISFNRHPGVTRDHDAFQHSYFLHQVKDELSLSSLCRRQQHCLLPVSQWRDAQ